MNKNKFILTFLCLGLVIVACKEEEEPIPAPTPYALVTPSSLPPPNIAADNPLTEEGILLGKMLFYEPALSGNGSQSCNGCHNQGKAFTDNGKALSKGIQGLEGIRNSMPLFNLMYHTDFLWDGRATSLRVQALLPIQDELEMNETLENVIQKLGDKEIYPMQFALAFGDETINEERISLAMEQFLTTLVSGSSKFDDYQAGDTELTESEHRGMEIYFGETNPSAVNVGGDCFHCHGGPLLSNNQFMNNGLDTEENFTDLGLYEATGRDIDRAKFKVPSLRNIAVTAPYMHDGRFATLEEVIEHYNSEVQESSTLDPNMHAIIEHGLNLSEQDKLDLINFLHTLTDQVYLNNTDYHSPFE